MSSFPIHIEAAGRSEQGRNRESNQDVFILRPDLGLFLVVDGMGGHPAGDVAAAVAAEAIQRFHDEPGTPWPGDAVGLRSAPRAYLAASVKHANLSIRERAAREPDTRGMGAAIVAMHATSTGFCVAHVGHARCYRVRGRRLEKLTEDHTRLTEYVWRGLPIDAALRMPDRAALSRALGVREHVEVTVGMDDARRGDLVMLCSNGLYGALSDNEMLGVLAGQSTVEATADALIALAAARGAQDDVTCVVLRWGTANGADGGGAEQPTQ